MKEQERKHIPVTRKIKRFFVPAKGKQPHKLYPEEYFKQIWLCHADHNLVTAIAGALKITRKEAVNQLIDWGFKYFMRMDLTEKTSDPQSKEELKESIQRKLARKLARQRGWHVNKIL
jgi:hypothetical protein